MLTTKDRQILHIALPSIISNITIPLLGLADVAIVGHLNNVAYIGAIAVGSMIFNVIYWLFGFLRMGTSGMTSQALGKRDFPEVIKLLQRSLLISMLVALLLIVLQRSIIQGALLLIQPEHAIIPFIKTYFSICIWGAPAMLSLYSITGWYIGMQNTRIPLLISIFQNVINILVSIILVYGFGKNIDGVAMGTLIALYAGAGSAFILWVQQYFRRLKKYFSWQEVIQSAQLMAFFRVNRDIFLRTLFLVAVNLFFTSAGAAQGNTILAINTLLLQLFTLFSYIMDGFAYSGEALSGKYYGANNKNAFLQTTLRLFLWGGFMTSLFTFTYAMGGEKFLSLLTDNSSILQASQSYFFWVLFIPITGMSAFIWDGIFIGITATRSMLISSAIATIVFFSVYYTFHHSLGNHALWLAFVLYLASRGLVQTLIFKFSIRPTL